jgi:hypothetical protein
MRQTSHATLQVLCIKTEVFPTTYHMFRKTPDPGFSCVTKAPRFCTHNHCAPSAPVDVHI